MDTRNGIMNSEMCRLVIPVGKKILLQLVSGAGAIRAGRTMGSCYASQ